MGNMTNFDAFRHYMEPVCSPDSFINMSFYWMISAALQRRVWMGSNERALYPNMYVVLCGDPGIGKGMVIKPISEILKTHKLQNAPKDETLISMGQDPDSYLSIPVAAETVTFEALTGALAKSVRRINYEALDEAGLHKVAKIYSHNSMAFVLEEMSSLFKKKTEDVTKFLLVAFDCGQYKYETKTKGTDIIKRCCVNLLAGTTPSFMQQSYNEQLMADGWSSRTIFVAEHCNRFETMFLRSPDESQLESKQQVIKHVAKLVDIYGLVEFSPEALVFLEDYWINVHPAIKAASNYKLKSYFARKNVHIMKLACAVHFAESTTMTIELGDVIRALDLLKDVEKRMAMALQFGGKKNPLESLRKEIIATLFAADSSPQFTVEHKFLIEKHLEDGRESEIKEVLRTLEAIGHVKPFSKNGHVFYTLQPQAATKDNVIDFASKLKQVI